MKKHSILIIDDSDQKREEIGKALPPGFDTPGWAQSIAQAYRTIQAQDWDLIVLDMTFHAAQNPGQDSAKESLAGIEILQFMARRRIDIPVIVATQHASFRDAIPEIKSIAALDKLLSKLFPKNYRETVAVDTSEESWKLHLQMAISRALGSKKNAYPDN